MAAEREPCPCHRCRAARAEVQEQLNLLQTRVDAVLRKHFDNDLGVCAHCLDLWPCDTRRTLTGERRTR